MQDLQHIQQVLRSQWGIMVHISVIEDRQRPIADAPDNNEPVSAQFHYEWSVATGRLKLIGATAASKGAGACIAQAHPDTMPKVQNMRVAP